MTIPNRTVAITGVFAKEASTTIPSSPVSGVSYRDTSMTKEEVEEGWPYKSVVDSASFNQALFQYATISSLIEKYGFLPWSNLTDYVAGSICLGSDGNLYQAIQATGPSSTAYDPVNDTSHTYWVAFLQSAMSLILGSVYPVGSIYIGTQTTCPLSDLITGSTWEKVEGRYLLASGTLAGTSETYSATNTVASGVPNITGSIGPVDRVYGEPSGAFYPNGAVASSGWTTSNNAPEVYFDASRSSSVYGSSLAVRSPAYVVNVWRRTA